MADNTLLTSEFRVAYETVFEKRPVDKDKPDGLKAYKLAMRFDKSDPATKEFVNQFRQTCAKAIAAEFPEIDKGELKKYVMGKDCELTKGGDRAEFNSFPLIDGDEPYALKKYPDGAGNFTLQAKRQDNAKREATPPAVVKLAGKNIVEIIDKKEFYAGCYAKAEITYYVYDHPKGKKGVTIGLNAVCKARDGEKIISSYETNTKEVFKSMVTEYAENDFESFESADSSADEDDFMFDE